MDTKKSTPSSQNERTTMTMHLARGLSTINTRKPKQKKLTQAQQDRLRIEWRAYNKRMRQAHCHSAQFELFEDYVLYTRGKLKPQAQKSVQYRDRLPQKSLVHRETKQYPSLSNNIAGIAPKRESPVYSGERQLLGVATMHKSNMVPIFADKKEDAKEIAQMRRN